MAESPQTPPSRGRKTLVIAALGAAAVCVLTAGSIVGAHISNGQVSRLCTDAATSAEETAETVKASIETADKARDLAGGAEGYDKRDGAAALLKTMDNATSGLTRIDLEGDCNSREDAKALRDSTTTVKDQAGELDDAAKKLTADVTAFQTEAKRVADDKAAADAAEALSVQGESAGAAEAAAAAQAPAPAAQPQYAGAGNAYAPAPQVPSNNYAPAPAAPAPAPAPYVPAPAPAPAPVTGGGTGGWTPPPAGQGGGGGCTQTSSGTFCTGG